jgi:putative ABC transport system substrate-binding protein
MNGKRLQLLKELAPRVSRVALLHPAGQGLDDPTTESAARALGLTLLAVPVDASQPITPTLTEVTQKHADALLVGGGTVLRYQREIIEFAATKRLPAMGVLPGYPRAGGLMGYGTSYVDLFRRSAVCVNKILKGAKPGDLPIEQPTKFEFVINLKTAKALGLTIPPSLLQRADEVIQ